MKKLLSVLIAAVFAVSTGTAFADSHMKAAGEKTEMKAEKAEKKEEMKAEKKAKKTKKAKKAKKAKKEEAK